MKFLVIGTGSVGRRHIANLRRLGHDVLAFSYRGRTSGEGVLDCDVQYVSQWVDAVKGDVDGVVVANSSEQHIAVALEVARIGKALFVEKPLSVSLAGVDELASYIHERALVVEAGFTLRAHPNLIWIKQFLANGSLGEIMSLHASVGQWLPDWRPGTDHRIGYGAFRERGGGVLFDLIHEIDVVGWLAGAIDEVVAMTRYVPALEIETEAIAQVGLRLSSGALAQIHLDYVRPVYGRTLEIVGSKGVLVWDYCRGEVLLCLPNAAPYITHRVSPVFERNDLFLEHMAHFLRRIENPDIQPLSSFDSGVEALRVALACHLSAEDRRVIRLSEVDADYQVKERRS